MAVAWLKQHRFNGGEINPQMVGRDDLDLYYSAAGSILNMLVLPTGAAVKRPGLARIAEIPEAAEGVRLAEFTFSAKQRYLFALLYEVVRIYHQDAAVADVVTPWTGTDVREMNWTQQADTFLGFHAKHEYQHIKRGSDHSLWTLDALPIRNGPTYHFGTVTTGTATATAKTGTSVNITSTASDFPVEVVEGWEIAINGGIGRVKTRNSATQVTVKILQDLLDTDPAGPGEWFVQEPQWSETRGWPAVGRFHRNRLALAGGSRPTNVALSTARDLFDFDTGAGDDDDAVIIDLLSDSIDDIQQMHSVNNRLLFLTSQGEWALEADPVTPKTPGATVFTQFGSSNIRPVQIEEGVFFVGNPELGRNSLFEAAWNIVDEGYTTEDVSQLAGHLIKNPIDMTARKGDGVNAANHVFVVNGNGTVSLFNTLRKQKVAGWSRLETEGQVLAAATLGPDTYFVVKRVFGAVDRYFLEKLDNGRRLDCSLIATSETPTTTFAGFDHLEGEMVQVRTGALVLPSVIVTEGVVTTPYEVTEIEAGLGFEWEIETLPVPDRALADLNGKDKMRIVQAEVDLLNSSGVQLDGRPVTIRRFGDELLDQDAPLITGPVKVRRIGWARRQTVRIHGDQPTSVTVRGLRVEVSV